jgi:murein DD-endopeptidase MepM/ murein hydrolase activator NlpD
MTPSPVATIPVLPASGATDQPDNLPVICSPLAEIDLDILGEIVSDPYLPPPSNNPEGRHHGIDFAFYNRGDLASILGMKVQSILPGSVAAALADTFPYGNFVIVETPYDLLTTSQREILSITATQSLYLLYAHLNAPPLSKTGQEIGACDQIGEAGKSGNAGNPHLHLEMRLGPPGVVFREMGYYKADDTAAERIQYKLWRTSGQFQHIEPLLLLRSNQQAQVDVNNSYQLIENHQ